MYRSIQIVPTSRYFIYSLISPFNHLLGINFSSIRSNIDHWRIRGPPSLELEAFFHPLSGKSFRSRRTRSSPPLQMPWIFKDLRISLPRRSTDRCIPPPIIPEFLDLLVPIHAERDPGANSINGNNLGNCLFATVSNRKKEWRKSERKRECRRRRMHFWTSLRFNNFPLEKGIVEWKIKCRGGNLTGEGM